MAEKSKCGRDIKARHLIKIGEVTFTDEFHSVEKDRHVQVVTACKVAYEVMEQNGLIAQVESVDLYYDGDSKRFSLALAYRSGWQPRREKPVCIVDLVKGELDSSRVLL